MNTANKAEMLSALLRDLQADRSAYGRMHDLLESQYQAALQHSSQTLAQLADDIFVLADQLSARAGRRGQVLRHLLGDEVPLSMQTLLSRLPEAPARSLGQAWAALEQQARDCKLLNQRNCQLITEQQVLMQRVLGAETGGLYAAP